MHEITLCQNVVDIITHHAQHNNAHRITAVWLEIGAFSYVESEALNFCFELVCRETLAEGCQLHLIMPPAQSWCYDCQQEIALLSPKALICPQCGGRNLRVTADDGMKIKRIEIE